MPSRLPGYPPDTGGRQAYSWHPHPQGVPSVPPPSSPPGAQSKPYYGYPHAVGPSGSFPGPHPPYTSSHPEQPPAEDLRGYPGYNDYAKEKSPEAPKDQDHYRRPPNQVGPYPPHLYGPPRGPSASPPSRTSSYEHRDYSRPPDAPPYVPIQHSRSSGSTGSSPKSTSPQKYPADGRPPHGYREAMPRNYVSARPPPPLHHGRGPASYASSSYDSDRPWTLNERGSPPSYPPEIDHRGHYEGVRDHYGWGRGPPPLPPPPPASYASQHPPYPPPPHAQRSLAPDCVSPRPSGYESRKVSDSSHGARAQSPTQIESSRRDEAANMGCTCKKSKCLKLYCMCFGASVVCGPNCRCLVCYNTPNFETERKEAVRAILSRNPAAFDTKFKKSIDQAVPAETDRSLSHKLGCKCRKSACTKKYCECFNAGIKCSATCRCMGCQNMPPGGFGPDPRYGYSVPPQSFPGARNITKYSTEAHAPSRPGEPWMVDAAQNLAFLKHASPNRSEGRPLGPSDAQAIASMPSLVSSDTTLNSDTDIVATEAAKPVSGKAQESGKSDGDVANVLLMAAYAMTELKPAAFANDPPSGILRSSPKRKSTELPNRDRKSCGTEITLKSAGGDDTAPDPFPDAPRQRDASTAATLLTPTALHKTKRSRLGSAKKHLHAESSFDANDTPAKHLVESDEDPENTSPSHTSPSVEGREEEVAATPAARTGSKDVLTPVSARCIDFKRMGVNEMTEKNIRDAP